LKHGDTPDKAALNQARDFIESTIKAERLVARHEYPVAAVRNFSDLTWATSVLANMIATKTLKESEGTREHLRTLSDVLERLIKERPVDDEARSTSRTFFRLLLDEVLRRSESPSDLMEAET
jgi:hypothetical protein